MNNFEVIGISGKAGCGKDYLIQNYLRKWGYYQISFAWHFKIWLISTGQATYEEVFITKPPHIRRLMQLEGTERGRNVYGENVWIETAYTWMRLWNETWGINKFVVGDVRFKNEASEIENRGGLVIRISAPGRVQNSPLTEEQRQHSSETDLDFYTFRYVIENDYEHVPQVENSLREILNISSI